MGFSRAGIPAHLEPWRSIWAASRNDFEVDLVPDYRILHDAGYNVLAYDLHNFAYAYLRRYPTQVRGVMLLDTPIAGVGGCEDLFTSSAFWHIGFHQTMSGGTGLAELLIAGREHRYFRSHIDRFAAHPDAISDADVAVYAHGYQGPQRLAAGFALYRAIPLDIASNERHAGTVDAPIQLAFAEYCHGTVLPEVAAGLGEAGSRYAVLPRRSTLRACGTRSWEPPLLAT
jgi:hypothetical protein